MQPSQDDPQRGVNVPRRDNTTPARMPEREAAASLMRQQIASIYDEPSTTENPYRRTHSENTDHSASSASQGGGDWNQYHTAWQSYYQQYYERYYLAQLKKRQHAVKPAETAEAPHAQESAPARTIASEPETLSKDEAVNELRSKLLTEVKERSQKVKKSRHFMPIMAAITVALVFGILQYNSLLIAQVKAYVSPGAIDPGNVVLDPSTSTKVGPEPKVVIPKINVDAPAVYDVPSLEENVIQNKLRDGVVHYPIPGANSVPGQKGNSVFLGHSSNDVFDNGNYKFVFVQLEKLEKGDTFYLNYQGTRYTYSITEKKVIKPTEVSQLVLDTDKPMATLVTCVPIGTALNRLVLIGEQISPDPSGATANQATNTQTMNTPGIAGNAPSLFERLFGF